MSTLNRPRPTRAPHLPAKPTSTGKPAAPTARGQDPGGPVHPRGPPPARLLLSEARGSVTAKSLRPQGQRPPPVPPPRLPRKERQLEEELLEDLENLDEPSEMDFRQLEEELRKGKEPIDEFDDDFEWGDDSEWGDDPEPAPAKPSPPRIDAAPKPTPRTGMPPVAKATALRPTPLSDFPKAAPQMPWALGHKTAGPWAQDKVQRMSPSAGLKQAFDRRMSPSGGLIKEAFNRRVGKPFERVFLAPMEDFNEDDARALDEQRESLQLHVEGYAPFRPMDSFEEAQGILPDYVFKNLERMGITEPMPIQAQALPIILGGHDLIGIAKTGSGKTLAFLLPAIPHMEAQRPIARGSVSPIVLILAPTRELAIQISQEAEKVLGGSQFGAHAPSGLVAQCAYGGGKRHEQLSYMQQQGCHVLAGTPGRLTDFIEAGDVKLNRVTYFVLDEADRMLDLGFQSDVQGAARRIRVDRQMLFFSATWVREVQGLATELCDQKSLPIKLRVGQGEEGKVTVRSEIVQDVEVFDNPNFEAREREKRERLSEHIMEMIQDPQNKILVFVNQKVLADELRDKLVAQGFRADSMHGGRGQGTRMAILEDFKQGQLQLLVATDVMGRGLDIQDITHIVIYDMCDLDDYVHRVGRTARGAGEQSGHALTFFEYDKRWPEMARELATIIENAGQDPPDDLLNIAEQVEAGSREIQPLGTKAKKKRSAGFMLDGSPVAQEAVWKKPKTESAPGQWVEWPKDKDGKMFCSFFGSAAGCLNGDKCKYSHADPLQVKICMNWLVGFCKYGDQCVGRHRRDF